MASLQQAVAAAGLADSGADVVGSNCGNGIEAMIEIAREFRRHTELPLVIQSNAGLPENRGGNVVYPESPAFWEERVGDLVEAGVDDLLICPTATACTPSAAWKIAA